MDLGLEDRLALIIGGGSGIGLATAKLFLAEGARVAAWDRNLSAESSDETEQIHFNQVDITDFSQLQAATQSLLAEHGQIDCVVQAAAMGSGKFGFPFDRLHPDDWRQVLEVNILGTTNVAHALAPVLREQQAGSMVFIASVAGQIGSQTDPPYSASKAANINFAQCLAKDLAAYGVRVNTVCPGMVQTPLNRAVWQAWNAEQAPEHRRSYEDWAGEKVRNVIPLQRWQTPADIANMIVFLSSERAAQITGQTINVDGGFVMHW